MFCTFFCRVSVMCSWFWKPINAGTIVEPPGFGYSAWERPAGVPASSCACRRRSRFSFRCQVLTPAFTAHRSGDRVTCQSALDINPMLPHRIVPEICFLSLVPKECFNDCH